MGETAPEYCRLCDETNCFCRQYLSQTLKAMERLAEDGDITITRAPNDRRKTDCRSSYEMFRRDFFIATGNHWKRKEDKP